jgi:FKBP-type peptidyl-prolyl cis-trans isomerase FkpA
MKIMLKTFAVSALALSIAACSGDDASRQDVELVTDADNYNYALGASVGFYIKENLDHQEEAEMEVQRETVIAAFAETLRGDGRMDQEEAEELVMELQQQVMQQRQEVVGGRSMREGQAYQEENAAREGVEVTDSGLQYEVLREGDGERPSETDVVEVHYEGRLVNGDVFDSSYERGEPAVFPLNRVIAGWTEGVQLMREGAQYRFVIPAELAYGDRDVGGAIPPNSTLIFEVELLSIVDEEDM